MPPIDERTTRFDLELPAEANTLKNDVARLRDSFGKLDTNAAKLDANGKLEETQIPDSVARLNATGLLKDDQLPLKVPLLDNAGKLPQSTIPDDARMNIMNAASEVLMLDLKATLGDVCNITTTPYKQYLLVKPDPTQRDSWRELPDKAVTSVNGRTGAVTVAEAGENADITGLTALSGPLRLGGDASGAYDAVTLRQLQAASGGAGGASMNGVMNNFIGAVEWFNGTRAKLPAGYVAADGQGLAKPAYPDLWAAVKAGMLNSVTEALWQNSGVSDNVPGNRGMYSLGSGMVDTGDFRVPDLNGVQAGSRQHNYLSSLGVGSSASPGYMDSSSAPQIKGGMATDLNGTAWVPSGQPSGAFYKGGTAATFKPNAGTFTNTGPDNNVVLFDAAKSSPVYRRADNEINPNAAYGIWIIRASGTFAAQNTNFNVIAGDTTAPAAGTLIEGGEIVSQYQIAGATHIQSVFQVKGKYLQDGWSEIALVDTVADKQVGTAELHPGSTFALRYDTPQPNGVQIGGVFRSISTGKTVANMYGQTEINGYSTIYFTLGKDGNTSYPARVMQFNEANDLVLFQNPTVTNATRGGAFSSRAADRYMNILSYDTPGVDGGAVLETGNGGSGIGFYFFATASDSNKTGKILSATRGLVMFEGSDARWKENKVPVKPGCLERIEQVEVCEYDWIDDGYHERGWIAQQLQEVDPQYVTGTDKLSVSTKALIADLIGSVQTLSARVKELEKSKK